MQNLVPCFTLFQTTDSKLKELAADNLNSEENGEKFLKLVKNTVGRKETACYEQFLLFHSVFKILIIALII